MNFSLTRLRLDDNSSLSISQPQGYRCRMIANNSGMKKLLILILISAFDIGFNPSLISEVYAQTPSKSKQYDHPIQRTFWGCKIGETNQEQFFQAIQANSNAQVRKQDNLILPLKARYYVYGLLFGSVPTQSVIFTFYEDVLVSVLMRYSGSAVINSFFQMTLLPEYSRRYKGFAVDMSMALSPQERALTHALYYDGTTALLIGTEYYIRYFNLKLFNEMREYSTSEL